jgi:hypothetical protein
MQPNDQQGYAQPDQNQPIQPVVPPPQSAPLDPAGVQTTIQESAPAPVSDPALQQATAGQPIDDGEEYDEYDDEDFDEEPVTWVAHEYIHQEKGALWFVIFTVVIVVLIAISLLLMNSWSFAALLAVIAVVVVVYSRRPPRELTYSITGEGLIVDEKLHKFESFKSFGVIRDGENFSVMLIPTQRFQPGITVYFPEESGEAIVDMLGSRLPMKDLKLDAVDRLVRLLRL